MRDSGAPKRTPLRRGTTMTIVPAIMLGLFPLSTTATADQLEPPPYYAVKNVTVKIGTGETLDNATVVIADGLIDAVGRGAEVPSDAWVIDGTGLVLYPGLIDAMTDLGQAAGEPPGPPGFPGGRPGGDPRPEIRGPEDRPGTTPWVNAADRLTTEDVRIENWREVGFTSAVTVPGDGFFAGQATLVNLGGHETQDMVVATPVAHRLNYGGRRRSRGFPGSLMGQISYVKQVFSDARHYAVANRLYAESPRGRLRPAYDRTLAPIGAAVEIGIPFLMPGHLGREIDRALAIAGEYSLRPIVYGGQGAYERLGELAGRATPVLVSLDWPEKERDRDPEADTPLRTHYHRRMAVRTPKLLHDKGIAFAFYSDGLSSPSKVLEGVRKAVEAGLSSDGALEALTLGAARIFGVDDRLGSVDAGKIANLVLATDDPWVEDAEVRHVFIDGRKYSEREEGPSEPPASDVSGRWELEGRSQYGETEFTLEVLMKPDGRVSGELNRKSEVRDIQKGRMSADHLRFKTTSTRGGRTVQGSWSFVVTGDEIEGSLKAGSFTMELTGERTGEAQAAGGDDAEGSAVSIAELERAMEHFRGPVAEHRVVAITNARVYTLDGAGTVIDSGTVIVRGGKIAAVGQDLEAPRGAEVIDAGGGSLIPGIIDAHSHIAVEGGVNEGSLPVTSMVTIEDVINPDDVAIYRALAGGVTSINVLHGSANPIGGRNAVLKLRWGQDADGLRFQAAPLGIKFALGENPKRSRGAGRGPQRYPATRMGVMDVIRQAFTETREYMAEWDDYERATKQGGNPTPPRIDFELEALAQILRGERLVHSHCYRADEILQLLRLAEEFGFKVATLQHVLEGYKVADEIAAHGAGASTFSDWWGYKVEAYDAIPHNAAIMTRRGVVVSINSDSGEEMRHLNQEAAKAMRWGGLDEVEALKLVTLNPAIQLGVDDRVGSIEVGKDADLVLYGGPPLSMFSVVQKTFVDGKVYFDVEADHERQAAIDSVKAKLGGGRSGRRETTAYMDDAGLQAWEEAWDNVWTDAFRARHHAGSKNVPTWSEPAYSCEEDH